MAMKTMRSEWWVVLCVATLATAPARAQDIGLALGTTPPPVRVEDLDGNEVDLARWVGKRPVVVEFWATWCPVCEALFPKLEAAQRRYGERVAFLVIAVAVNQSPRSIRRHLERHPMPFATVLWDRGGAAVRAFDAFTTSYVVVLDASGKVAYTGAGEDQDIAGALSALLAASR
jgi:thiol-disulfide isomerase/thioredoxin